MNLFWTIFILIALVIIAILLMAFVFFRKKAKHGENIKPELVAFLLLMILVTGGIIRSNLLDTVSALATGPQAPTPTPAPSPTPPGDSIFLKLPVEDLAQVEGFTSEFSAPMPARLVVVVKESETTTNGTVVARHTSEQFCVEVPAFLDEADVWLKGNDKNEAVSVLVTLKISDLARYGEAAPDKVQLYLVPDLACVK